MAPSDSQHSVIAHHCFRASSSCESRPIGEWEQGTLRTLGQAAEQFGGLATDRTACKYHERKKITRREQAAETHHGANPERDDEITLGRYEGAADRLGHMEHAQLPL